MIDRVERYTCYKCGKTVIGYPPPIDWIMETQPTRMTCPTCIRRSSDCYSDPYDEDYFLRGKETGKSLYDNYRWLPDLTVPMVASMISYLGIKTDHTILDFGCARGYVVRAFRELGYNAFGYDVSRWAVENCDPEVRSWVSYAEGPMETASYDWVIAKDVLEHVPDICKAIGLLARAARVGIFAVVPLSYLDDGRYVVPAYEKDVTHLHRLTLATWVKMFIRPGWSVEARYRVEGVKDNYFRPKYEMGNGFITCRRLR